MNGWRRERELVVVEWARFAVHAESLTTVLTIITTERQTELSQRLEQRQQQAPALC